MSVDCTIAYSGKIASLIIETSALAFKAEEIAAQVNVNLLGVANSILEKSGSWLSYKGERIGQGRENAKQFLKDNTDIRQTIDLELRNDSWNGTLG